MAPDDARVLFDRTFGGEPTVVASAPGRVNLIGELRQFGLQSL
jgi:galactokinase